jgi:hypothetical protein
VVTRTQLIKLVTERNQGRIISLAMELRGENAPSGNSGTSSKIWKSFDITEYDKTRQPVKFSCIRMNIPEPKRSGDRLAYGLGQRPDQSESNPHPPTQTANAVIAVATYDQNHFRRRNG